MGDIFPFRSEGGRLVSCRSLATEVDVLVLLGISSPAASRVDPGNGKNSCNPGGLVAYGHQVYTCGQQLSCISWDSADASMRIRAIFDASISGTVDLKSQIGKRSVCFTEQRERLV